jgi:crotonobetainyl-CoA:carnitine CoA-transferase CaiB-like acyl-CoA transferase
MAYMTGPSRKPLRAVASVTDIMAGTYGVVGILTALYERERTGQGQYVLSTLFESVAFLVGQHMTYSTSHK